MPSSPQKKSIPDLPAEIRDEIIAYWDPIVVANFSLCCKLYLSIVSEFSTRHYGVQYAYGKYFTFSEIGQLQDLQANTGLIAYGPTVLNFFTQASHRSPLDTVCQLDHCLSVGLWYIAKEYAYGPEQPQLESFEKDVKRVQELLRQSRSDNVDEMADFQEVLSGIVQTWSFYKGSKHVRLVASSGSPLEVVFSLPSTCLMNVFTHRAAYCLFPQMTLVNDVALINTVDVTSTDDQQVHIADFSRLGYTFLKMPSIAMSTNPDCALSFLCARSVGDRHCLVKKFDHYGTADPKPDFIEAHSWNMSYHLNSTSFTYMPLGTNHCKFEYTIAPQLWDSTIAKLNTLGRLHQRSHLQ
ncbi:hypothetical protein GG344DRAFT_74019 [Lentinula edodes]|nr:hypothetical protein GG344DRAFT_74019 [Lentinula edodes]